jgi:SAM-dependent methyltransferase
VDDWLLAAGATSVEAMDHSNFEGATVIHNLNEPLAPALHGQFDTVIDAGTLEHIFNVPLALSTYLQLLKPGGRLVLVTVANNCCGHGFYQFSPEFFFRVFSEENGCRLEALQMAEDQIVVPRIGKFQPVVNLPGRVYTVTDPNSIGQRVELMNRRQTTIMVDVIKTRECPLFSKPPQQSDYAAAWTQAEAPTETVRSSVRDWLVRSFKPSTLREVCFRFLPWVIGPIVRLLPAGYFGNYRFSNRRFYTRVD